MDPVLNELKALSDGLLFMSESDYPFEIIDLGIIDTETLTQDELLAMLGRLTDTPAETVDLKYFFRNMTKSRPESSEEKKAEVARFRKLEKFLEEALKEVKVFRLGSVRIEAFILGTTSANRLVGLKTHLIET